MESREGDRGRSTVRSVMAEREPTNVVPGMSDLSLVLHNGPDVLVGVHGFRVWPSGTSFTLAVHQRNSQAHPDRVPQFWHQGADAGQPLFEVGVRFADGRQVWSSHVTGWGGGPAGSANLGVLLRPGGGGGSSSVLTLDWWLSPLPPAGAVGFGCRWVSAGVAETWQYADPETLRSASERVTPAGWETPRRG